MGDPIYNFDAIFFNSANELICLNRFLIFVRSFNRPFGFGQYCFIKSGKAGEGLLPKFNSAATSS